MRRLSTLAAFILVAPVLHAQTPAPVPVQFNRDIRPLLSDNCFLCHGPDSARRKASLRLDTEEGLFGKRDDSPAVVKNQPEKSPLYARIVTHDAKDLMPPAKSNKKLTQAQKDLVKRWIQEGAPYENHWAFVAPKRPAVPTVKNAAWVKNPIDAFILARLESVGLTPAAEADRRALIRRVTLDLIGLPPTPEEVEAFVQDKSPNAYETIVNRLLASEHYGEHRGRYWLDAARYGDTHGLHFDNYREMWPYRDWVIRAFNKNMPYDQFTIEQLAGDLLPNRTPDQLVASGFHRCNITTNEGGSISEEVLVSYARDRVETTATVWLGLTAGCCQCHNHKFDPLAQKEFYQMAAYFRNTAQGAMDGNIPNTPPVIVVPGMADRPRWDELQKRQTDLKATMQKRKTDGQKAFDDWRVSGAVAQLNSPLDSARETVVAALDDAKARVAGKDITLTMPKGVTSGAGPVPNSKATLFTDPAGIDVPDVPGFAPDKAFSVSAWVFAPEDGVIASDIGTAKDKNHGWRLALNKRTLGLTLVGNDPKSDTLARDTGGVKIEANKWTHVVATYDGSRQPNGILFFVNGKQVETPRITSKAKQLKGSIANTAPLRLGDGFKGGGLADVRVFDRAVNAEEASILSGWLGLKPQLGGEPAKLNPSLLPTLSLIYFNRFDAEYPKAVTELVEVGDEIKDIQRRSPVTHVMQENPGMPTAKVLNRGQYDQPKETVTPGVFGILNPLPKDAPNNRLGLAKWIIDPANPLTARVAVNRTWQEIFGVGLVKSAEDFGAQGETPSHPELLDWLALEFRETGWDVKKLIKLIVTSNTYKQAAITTPEKREKDAANRLLSRGPRYRMDAEMLRDHALAASGLLVPQIGGASVKPYQPEGVWESVGILGASNTRDYRRDAGEGLYRRSMYWFWKRMSPPASMEIFNAPSRETCSVRRERTNTPLQALVTMNDPQFVEAARHLAQVSLLKKDLSDEARADFLAMRLMARPFRDAERKIVLASLAEFADYYKANPKEAAKLIAVGDSRADASLDVPTLAAWTMVANELMNLDEVLNK